MTIEVRPVADDDERRALMTTISAAFGDAWTEPSAERQAIVERLRQRSRELVAVVDGSVRGGCFSYDLHLTLPGGEAVPVSGLAGVGVDPTFTGRGVLRALMAAHLDDTRQRGEAASALLASESLLYRRFGYGPVTSAATYEAASREAGLHQPFDDDGTLALESDRGTARSLAQDVYARVAGRLAGTVSRSAAWWDAVFSTEASWLGGGPFLTVVHRDAAGTPDGYLMYAVERAADDHSWLARDVVVVRELVGSTLDAELALWRFAVGVPLTRTVRLELAPVDLRLRWHLADPRQLRARAVRDMLWLRPVDLGPLVERRRYDAPGRVSFALDVPGDDRLAGPWTVTVEGGRGTLERGGEPQVHLALPALANALLGDVRLVELAAAGLVSGDAAALRRLSTLLATDTRPFNLSKF
jgi:predicted acetyltransferase